MDAMKLLAVVLIVAGVLALVYGTFSYTSDTHGIKVGSMEMSVDEKETVNLPVWSGVGAIGAGALLLLLRSRR